MVKIDSITSKTIDNIRLPLILGVVLIHCAPNNLYGGEPITRWVIYFICNDFARVCVPLFFFISGYLFFTGIEKFTKEVYVRKLKSRFWSLLIPYLIWNTVCVLYYIRLYISDAEDSLGLLLYKLICAYIGDFSNPSTNVLGAYNYPINLPLWFIRNLMVYTILSPLFYYIIKKWGKPLLVILSLAFLTGFWFQMLFCNIFGVLFFSLGAFFAIEGIELSKIIKDNTRISKAIVYIYPFFVIADSIAFVWFTEIYYYVHTMQIYLGVFAVYIIFHWITVKTDYRSLISGQVVFAIYVIHGYISFKLLEVGRWFDLNKWFDCLVVICFAFVGSTLISLLIYSAIKLVNPKAAAICFGNRGAPAFFKKRDGSTSQ